ncbi:uncharacterized protein PAC_01097 [Phialocephala subalpina]|uniref:PLC-like phosphodiesterase n=1 Tax=Phialocephala subalpina TaxID=576137 RepID=A0A1L7WEL4_9HELO|nr:uncharacterized protein PAC_01097 [Phialocephala subalpina]
MGIGSYFLFINATPWPFHLLKQHSYQMNTWDFPSVVDSGTAMRVYMEEQATGNEGDDSAEALYTINNSHLEFEILYRALSSFQPLEVSFNNSFHTLNNPSDTVLPLQWGQDVNAPFILASSDTDVATATFVGQNPPESWMHDIYDRISCLSLREIAMPGTHDAGMSEFNGGAGAAVPADTLTQTLNIGDQLKYGARWFDLRPVIAGGQWATGHYSFTLNAWRGGNGQNIASVISQINDFTSNNQELIILDLTHGYNTDVFNGDENNHLTQDNWDDLINVLLGIKHRITGLSSSVDLSTMLVSDFIKDGPAVLIIIDDSIEGGGGVEFSSKVSSGFFSPNQLPVYNNYANSDNPTQMYNDQIGKMLSKRPNATSEMFLLSWTLTQTWVEIINPLFASLLDMAIEPNIALYDVLWEKMSSTQYPNILLIDSYPANGDVVALAMAINYHFAGKCISLNNPFGKLGQAILSVGGGSLI